MDQQRAELIKALLSGPNAIERMLRIASRPAPVPVTITDVGQGQLVTSFQHMGGRSEQQDRVSIFKLKPGAETNMQRFFKKLHTGLSASFSRKVLTEGGAVASLALVHGRDITIANLGDSRFSLGMSSDHFLRPRYKCLTTDDVPANAAEQRRILKAGGTIEDGRLVSARGSLAVSAAFGDMAYDQWLRRTPHVTHINLDNPRWKIDDNNQLILVGETDGSHLTRSYHERTVSLTSGLDEKNRFDLTALATSFNATAVKKERQSRDAFMRSLDERQLKLLKQTIAGTEEPIAEYGEDFEAMMGDLMHVQSYFSISRDNFSFAAVEIPNKSSGTESEPFGIFMVDAHGPEGEKVADGLVELVESDLKL